MGGLHIAMDFMKCIGDHMSGSGLYELWMECELLGPIAAQNVLGGKHYSRGIRAHQISAQAIWKSLLPNLLSFVANKNVDHSQTVHDNYERTNRHLIKYRGSAEPRFQGIFVKF